MSVKTIVTHFRDCEIFEVALLCEIDLLGLDDLDIAARSNPTHRTFSAGI